MDDATSPLKKYHADYKDAVERHRERAFEYEKLSVDYTHNAFRTLTYMNGGALVAIPTALSLFGTDAKQARTYIIAAAIAFVFGILTAVGAQVAAFFVMAKRSEAEGAREDERAMVIGGMHYPPSDDAAARELAESALAKANLANDRVDASNAYRVAGIFMVTLSVAAFCVGCVFGAVHVMKQPVSVSAPAAAGATAKP